MKVFFYTENDSEAFCETRRFAGMSAESSLLFGTADKCTYGRKRYDRIQKRRRLDGGTGGAEEK